MLVSPAVATASPAGSHVSFSAWGFAASTPFIGAGRNNFSHGVKILFRTLCPEAKQVCFEVNQAVFRFKAAAVPNQGNRCSNAGQHSADPDLAVLCSLLSALCSLSQKKTAARFDLAATGFWLQPYFALCLLDLMQNPVRGCTRY
jgi:hypothetical protein